MLEIGLVLAAVALYLAHGAWSGRRKHRSARRVAASRSALQAVLDEGGEDHRAGLSGLPPRLQIEVLVGLAPRLTGDQRRHMTTLAAEVGLLALASARCRSGRWWRRLQGARLFTLLGGGEDSVPALVTDRRGEVRAEAARWAVEHHDDELVDHLLGMLHADDPSTRFTVKDTLIRIGRPVVERLALHLEEHTGPSLAPALEVAGSLPDAVLLPAALALCEDSDAHIRALAGGLAGAIGGGPAVEALLNLAVDHDAEVRAAAARALGRAGHWQAAPTLAPLLGDPSWEVRRQASVALRRLGSPGLLFLRQALSAADPCAADEARHMLDLPDSALRTL